MSLDCLELGLNLESAHVEQPGDDEILQEAYDLGLVDETGVLIGLHEAGPSVPGKRRVANYNTEVRKILLTKESKVSKLVRRTCIILAKQANDPLYAEWRKHMAIAVSAREKMVAKYQSKAKTRSKEIIAQSKKSDFVAKSLGIVAKAASTVKSGADLPSK